MLVACVSATDDLLTTTQRLRDYLGATSTADDALQGFLVAAASKAVQEYVGYPLLRQNYEETVKGIGTMRLMLSRTPIRGVFGVFVGTDTGTDTEITSTEFEVEDEAAGLLRRKIGNFPWSAQWGGGFVETEPMPGMELPRYMVRYEAGYVFTQAADFGSCSTDYGTTSTSRSLPESIELAVLQTAKSAWLGRKRDSTVESKSVGDLSINYRSVGADIAVPEAARGLLRSYVRINV